MSDKVNAKRTVIRFFDAWKHKDWPICLSYVQITWKRDADRRNSGMWNRIKNMFGKGHTNLSAMEALQMRLEEHDISDIRTVEMGNAKGLKRDRAEQAVVSVQFGDGSTGKLRVVLICEKGPYQADPNGTWGVNPNSIRPV